MRRGTSEISLSSLEKQPGGKRSISYTDVAQKSLQMLCGNPDGSHIEGARVRKRAFYCLSGTTARSLLRRENSRCVGGQRSCNFRSIELQSARSAVPWKESNQSPAYQHRCM